MGVDRYWEAQDELSACPAKLAAANARIADLERVLALDEQELESLRGLWMDNEINRQREAARAAIPLRERAQVYERRAALLMRIYERATGRAISVASGGTKL